MPFGQDSKWEEEDEENEKSQRKNKKQREIKPKNKRTRTIGCGALKRGLTICARREIALRVDACFLKEAHRQTAQLEILVSSDRVSYFRIGGVALLVPKPIDGHSEELDGIVKILFNVRGSGSLHVQFSPPEGVSACLVSGQLS